MDEPDLKSQEAQTALALAALAAAFAQTLGELFPHSDSLATLQRKVQVEHSRLRQTPDAGAAVRMLRIVRDILRNPDVIAQPGDEEGS
jgi:hypothetical protein